MNIQRRVNILKLCLRDLRRPPQGRYQEQLDEEAGGHHPDGDPAPAHRGEGQQEDGGGPGQQPRLPLPRRPRQLLRLGRGALNQSNME